METKGDRAREARKSTGLSQPKLAKLIGCTPSALSQLENDITQKPSGWLLLGLERHTGHSAIWIVSGKGPKLTPYGAASDPEAEKLRSTYEAILSLPPAHQRKVVQDVDFLLSLNPETDVDQ